MQKATRQQTKNHNATLVLKTIYHHEEISRADIARLTGLTRTTVSGIVSDLIEQRLVLTAGIGESIAGKPPIQLSLDENAHQIICVDLSSGEFYGAVINLRGQVLVRERLFPDPTSGEQSLDLIYQLVDRLLADCTSKVLGIGVGSPGVVDPHQGIIQQAVNRGWDNFPLAALLTERFHLPTYVINDSYAAALAEYTFGGQQVANLVAVKIGNGIGSGIVMGGQLHYGDGFGAGEIGHLRVVEKGLPCTCGNCGCLETVSSDRALLQLANQLVVSHPSSILSSAARSGTLEMADIDRAYQAGDPLVHELITNAGRYLGVAFANLIGILNINRIVISGNFGAYGNLLLDTAQSEIRQRVLPSLAAGTQISFSQIEKDHVLLGASALVLHRELGLP